MNTVIKQLRREVCNLITKGCQISSSIATLKWREGSLPEIQRLRSERDAAGHRVHGKKSLSRFRRPKTGAERNRLWWEKRAIGYDARNHLLVYGMLRGKLYLKIEKNSKHLPSAYALKTCMDQYLKDSSITEEQIQTWLDGGSAPVWKTKVEAA